VALGRDGNAVGEIFIDDGESLNTYENGIYNLITFSATSSDDGSQGVLTSAVVHNGYAATLPPLGMITIFGVSQSSTNTVVTVNGNPVNTFTYSSSTEVLTITALSLPITQINTVKWLN